MDHILVVEDDSTIFQPLLDFLARNSFQVTHAGTLKEADVAIGDRPDAVVLDWALPDGDGVQWLKALRTRGYLKPVIMLTARADLLDKVVGLEGGANDYLTKPFEPRELVARLHAQLRAFQAPRNAGAKTFESPIAVSGIVLDPGTLEVTWKGAPVSLTQMEFKLLKYFLEHPRLALSRENILNAVWGLRYLPGEESSLEGIQKVVPLIVERNERYGRQLGLFMAFEKATQSFIGWFILRPDRKQPDDTRTLEIGYRLRTHFWGKGYGTEASLSLLDKARSQFGARRIYAEAMPANRASIRIMEKIGLRYETMLAETGKDGSTHEFVVYSREFEAE